MAKTEYDPDMQPIPIRSYTNAFELQIFNRAFWIDWITLSLVIFLIILLIGLIYPINILYKWLWDHQYYIVQYAIVPVFSAFAIIKLTKRDGVSFWRWVAVLVADLFTKDRFAPYQEGNWINRVIDKYYGEEE
jgi:hypothetical protein